MKRFTCYIKSHADCPDYERTIEAENFEQAIDIFYNSGFRLTGWDKITLREYVYEEPSKAS